MAINYLKKRNLHIVAADVLGEDIPKLKDCIYRKNRGHESLECSDDSCHIIRICHYVGRHFTIRKYYYDVNLDKNIELFWKVIDFSDYEELMHRLFIFDDPELPAPDQEESSLELPFFDACGSEPTEDKRTAFEIIDAMIDKGVSSSYDNVVEYTLGSIRGRISLAHYFRLITNDELELLELKLSDLEISVRG